MSTKINITDTYYHNGHYTKNACGNYAVWYGSKLSNFVRFEVFMAMTMKNIVFWDVVLCGSRQPTFRRNASPPSSGQVTADWSPEERNTQLKGKQAGWRSGLYKNRDHRGGWVQAMARKQRAKVG
jgi:hypothetical protein